MKPLIGYGSDVSARTHDLSAIVDSDGKSNRTLIWPTCLEPHVLNNRWSFAKKSAGRIMRRFVHSGCEVHRPAASGQLFPALPRPSELGNSSRAIDAFWSWRNRRNRT